MISGTSPIPASPWPVKPIWTLLASREEFGGHLPLLSMSAQFGVKLRPEGEGRAASEDTSNYRIVRTGDLVVNRLVARDGAYGVSTFDGIISPAYWVLKPCDDMDALWLEFVLKSAPYRTEIARLSKDMPPAQFDLPWDQFKSVMIPCPPILLQRRISEGLARAARGIDQLIERKVRLLTLIGEQHVSLSRELVSNAELDVGRKRCTLKSLFSFSKGVEAQRLNRDFVESNPGEYPVYSGQTKGSGFFGKIDTYDFDCPRGAILVATVGAEAMSTRIVRGRFSLSQNCALLTPRAGASFELEFLKATIDTVFAEMRANIPDHMQPSLRIEDLHGVWLDLPEISVQSALAKNIKRSESRCKQLQDLLTLQIRILEERREALITAAVTGQLEI